MMTRAAREALALAEQAVQPGDADVVQPRRRRCPSAPPCAPPLRRPAGRTCRPRRRRSCPCPARHVLLTERDEGCIGVIRRVRARVARTASKRGRRSRASPAASIRVRRSRRRWPRSGQVFCLSRGRLRGSPGGRSGDDRRGRTPDPRTAGRGAPRAAARRAAAAIELAARHLIEQILELFV